MRMLACTFVACEGGGLATVSNTRKAGFLTSVDGFASMTYHANGMIKTVQHATTSQAVMLSLGCFLGLAQHRDAPPAGATGRP